MFAAYMHVPLHLHFFVKLLNIRKQLFSHIMLTSDIFHISDFIQLKLTITDRHSLYKR